ncbi:MAG: type II toxin-antitoxin system HicA family toxin [Deltaproteobacteria bacterium]|nr:type II toxin-antitoxin system HicA family toxin [Deltaproteobacteria bacterium]
MTLVPSLSYSVIISALQRAGWRVDRQKGSHIRLSRLSEGKLRKLTVPAHRPVKRSTLAKIVKQAGMTMEELLTFI